MVRCKFFAQEDLWQTAAAGFVASVCLITTCERKDFSKEKGVDKPILYYRIEELRERRPHRPTMFRLQTNVLREGECRKTA